MVLKVHNVCRLIGIISISSFLVFMLSCSSTKKTTEMDIELKEVLEYIVKKNSSEIYYKTIIRDVNKSIASYINEEYLEFYLCLKKIDSVVKIPKKEIQYVKRKFKEQSIQNLNKLLPKLKNNIKKNREKFKTKYISMPVLFRSNTMALYYNLQEYGGEFTLLKKNNGKWEVICGRSVWIE